MIKKIALVFKYELSSQLKKKTVRITTAVFMLIILGVFTAFRFNLFGGAGQTLQSLMAGQEDYSNFNTDVGFVFDDENTKNLYLAKISPAEGNIFTNVEELNASVKDGKLKVGVHVKSLKDIDTIWLDRTLDDGPAYNLSGLAEDILKQDYMEQKNLNAEELEELLVLKTNVKDVVLGRDSRLGVLPAFAMTILIYIVVLMYGSITATVIAREKDNKTMELLITSCKPRDLIVGKVLGSGAAALIQTVFLLLAVAIGYKMNEAYLPLMLKAALSGTMTTQYIIVFSFYAVFGFILYLFLYAALGSTVSRVEDVNNSTSLVQFIFMIGYFMASFGMNAPTSPMLRIGSIIPFTSIMTMPLRSALVSVPFTDYLISAVLLLITTVFLAYISIKIYRWGTLNYGNKKGFFRAIKAALKYKG